MPYKVVGNTVVRADTGKVVGHSKNPKKYLRALYANAHKEKAGPTQQREQRTGRYAVILNKLKKKKRHGPVIAQMHKAKRDVRRIKRDKLGRFARVAAAASGAGLLSYLLTRHRPAWRPAKASEKKIFSPDQAQRQYEDWDYIKNYSARSRAFYAKLRKKYAPRTVRVNYGRSYPKPKGHWADYLFIKSWGRDYGGVFGGYLAAGKAFNPKQPRWPKGNPRGGEWRGVGGKPSTAIVPAGSLISMVGVGLRHLAVRAGVAAGVSAISRTHKLPGGFPQVQVKTVGGRGLHGDYTPGMIKGRAGGTIRMGTRGRQPALTLAHEFGHHLDQYQPGLRKAVAPHLAKSKLIRDWERIQANAGRLQIGNQIYMIPLRMTRYLLRADEGFARAYSQYVAIRSKNRRMRRELREAQRDFLSGYWSDRDFKPIAEIFDRYLGAYG